MTDNHSSQNQRHLENLAFIEASDTYFRDHEGNVALYKRPDEKTLVVVIRQTYPDRVGDIVNITNIALAGIPTLPRLVGTYTSIRQIQAKYPDHKIDIAGWSAGGLEAQLFSGMVSQAYAYNPGSTYNYLGNQVQYPNLHIYRNQTDLVSMFPTHGAASVTNVESGLFNHGLTNIFKDVMNKRLQQLKSQGKIDQFRQLKSEYQKYYVNSRRALTQEERKEVLNATLPTLRKKVEEVNRELALMDQKYKDPVFREKMLGQMRQKGLGQGQEYFNQYYQQYWKHRSTSQDIVEMARCLRKFIPKNQDVEMAFDIGVNLLSKAMSDEPFTFGHADVISNLMQVVLPRIIPKEVMEVIRVGGLVRQVTENALKLANICQKTITSTAMKAHAASLVVGIANVIVSLLPVPDEVKEVFNLAASLTCVAFLLASGAPFIPLVIALFGLFCAFKDMNLGCNNKKGKNSGGGSGDAKGNSPGTGGGSQTNPQGSGNGKNSANNQTGSKGAGTDTKSNAKNPSAPGGQPPPNNPNTNGNDPNGKSQQQQQSSPNTGSKQDNGQDQPGRKNIDALEPQTQTKNRHQANISDKNAQGLNPNERTNQNPHKPKQQLPKKRDTPTVQQVPLPHEQPLERPNPNDSKQESFDKFIRNFSKKLFQGNKMMTLQEARRVEKEEQEKEYGQLPRKRIRKLDQVNGNESQGMVEEEDQYPGYDPQNPDPNPKREKDGAEIDELQKKKKGRTQNATFQTGFWNSDFTKNTHHGIRPHQSQQKQFEKSEQSSKAGLDKKNIGKGRNLKKNLTRIGFAEQVPRNEFNCNNVEPDIVSQGRYFSEKRIQQFNKAKYLPAGRFNKDKDQLVTNNVDDQVNPKRKNMKGNVVFKNVNMSKESGKVTEYKGGQKRVLIPDSYFSEDKNQHPELIKEKKDGSIAKGVLNPNVSGSYTINTKDFFHSLELDTASAIQLALPSEMLYLMEDDLSILFYKKYFDRTILGYQRTEESIEKEEDQNKKKAGLAHLSHQQLRYKILGEREQYDEYAVGGTYQIVSQDQLPINTANRYKLSGQFRSKHPMRLMIGFICYDKNKNIIPGYEVIKVGQFVTYNSYNHQTKQLHVNGDLSGWNSFPKHKKLLDRFLGFYLNGDTLTRPQLTIICDDDPTLETQEDSGFISVDNIKKTIKLSNHAAKLIPDKLTANVTKLANHVYDQNHPTLICVDIKNLQPSESFSDVNIEVTGEGREMGKPWQQEVIQTTFWPQTAFVQVALYTNWFGSEKRQQKGQLIWRNVCFDQV